jgi:predicted amidohydrolase YtcJ
MRGSVRSRLPLLSGFVLVALAAAGCGPRVEPADLVLTNGHLATVDAARPTAEALAVRGETIVAVGSVADIKAYIGQKTEVIDLEGRFAMPAFIESHAHFAEVGEAKLSLDLMKARTWDDIVSMVQAAAAKARPGEWILGRGWHQEKWSRVPAGAVEGFPTHELLSKVSPDNPVYLTHASGHASIANAKAMALAGVTRATRNPAGGEILRDRAGNPIGVFTETASSLVGRALNAALARRTRAQVEADAVRAIETADREYLSKGVATVHDAGVGFDAVELYKKLAEQGRLNVRLYVMINEPSARLAGNLATYRMVGAGKGHLTVRAIKRIMDGALGSRGAWLLEPYSDLPSSTGLNTESMDEMKTTAALAIENGWQLCTHAIGDRGNREVLNVYEETFNAHPDRKDLRWRVEHAQHLNQADIPRFAALGVIPSMQGIHCTSDGPFVLARLGPERASEGAYAWHKLIASGAIVPNGTDAPVEAPDTLPGYYALVTRKMKNGDVFYGEERMTREEALRSYTLNGAYAAFEEKIKGSLTPGKLADITVLSADITRIPEEEIPRAEVLYTIVGGKLRYKK